MNAKEAATLALSHSPQGSATIYAHIKAEIAAAVQQGQYSLYWYQPCPGQVAARLEGEGYLVATISPGDGEPYLLISWAYA